MSVFDAHNLETIHNGLIYVYVSTDFEIGAPTAIYCPIDGEIFTVSGSCKNFTIHGEKIGSEIIPSTWSRTGVQISLICETLNLPELILSGNYQHTPFIVSGAYETILLPNLQTIAYNAHGNLQQGVIQNSSISHIQFPSLNRVELYGETKNLFYQISDLSYIDFSGVAYAGSTYNTASLCRDCFDLNKILFNSPQLENIQICTNCNNLIDIEFNNMDYYIKLQQYNPSIAMSDVHDNLVTDTQKCSNNKEQFLYNFREHIVKRLKPQQSTLKYVYLHADTKALILGEDTTEFTKTWIVPGESDTYLNTLNDELTARKWGLTT